MLGSTTQEERDSMDLDWQEKFKDVVKKMDEIGQAYALAKGQSWQMQELKGAVLASMILEQVNVPMSKAEVTAKASNPYKLHLEETAKAITKELQLKSQYEKEKARFEAYRSLSSLEKKTRSLIGE